MIGRFQFKSDIHRGDRLNPTVTRGKWTRDSVVEVSLGICGYRYHTTRMYMRTYLYT